ncbi:ATP-binding protein [Curtanaerobium respiraculi]|uniref:ATP-binding protein n=1 Tax=Curtanaerobium respiraculi TaxID=2949669 RepID=UPI0024B39CD3|nr:DUF4143 domain-containing protein [Curtanaerobium respiraculi]
MEYLPRVADELLERKLSAFGAINITGPKGCGKTTTAKQHAGSFVEFQDEDVREGLLQVASVQPSRLLAGARPRLFDEWQDAPKIWGAVRKSVDDEGRRGMYILTGSSSADVETPHTGTLRISTLEMLPMSLFESRESNGEVSLLGLFDEPNDYQGCTSELTVDGLIFSICRGGWPSTISMESDDLRLDVARDLFWQTAHVDISRVDGVRRNPLVAEAILRSYARNICTPAQRKTLIADVRGNHDVGGTAYDEYVAALEKLHIVSDVPAWSPAIRSKTSLRSSVKRNLVDPSVAVAALGLSPSYFDTDFKTLGFLFESLCIRDLKAYSVAMGGQMSYYRDRYGLEADGVLHLADGRYALIEFKLGSHEINDGAKHLCKIESLVEEHNEKEKQVPLRPPDLKLVVTGTQYGYRRDDGVLVVPLACLRP